jgi:hypothetical protein
VEAQEVAKPACGAAALDCTFETVFKMNDTGEEI